MTATFSNVPHQDMAIADDLIVGAEAIAEYLGWDTRRIYRAREGRSSMPIRRRRGLGVYAFKSELEGWLRDPTSLRPEAAAASSSWNTKRPHNDGH